jgi:hypothetical protein
MDTSDTLLWSRKVFGDEDETGIHPGVQTRGGRAAGEQRPAPHANRNRVGNFTLDAAQLADRWARR